MKSGIEGHQEAEELRMKFDEDPENYHRSRPDYPGALFFDLIAYAGLEGERSALEVGIGTGQATGPILATGCRVTGLDLGDRMIAYCQKRFSGMPGFQAECVSFENFDTQETYDVLYSATAFHWVPPEVGFPKAYRLLRPGGTIALFWNHPFVGRAEDPLHREIQRAYRRYRPGTAAPREFAEPDCSRYRDLLEEYGFAEVQYRLYHRTRVMDGASYLALLNTYSDHRSMEADARTGLLREIWEAIEAFGKSITIYDTVDLYLGRRV